MLKPARMLRNDQILNSNLELHDTESSTLDIGLLEPAIHSQEQGGEIQRLLTNIENGSQELRSILLDGCSVILECKRCEQLFRQVDTFLLHKRTYCTGRYQSVSSYPQYDSTLVQQGALGTRIRVEQVPDEQYEARLEEQQRQEVEREERRLERERAEQEAALEEAELIRAKKAGKKGKKKKSTSKKFTTTTANKKG